MKAVRFLAVIALLVPLAVFSGSASARAQRTHAVTKEALTVDISATAGVPNGKVKLKWTINHKVQHRVCTKATCSYVVPKKLGVSLKAIPHKGYRFVSWTILGSSAGAKPVVIKKTGVLQSMNHAYTATATFTHM